MPIDYVLLQNESERLIDENGRDVILLKRNRTASVGAQPWRGADDLPLEVEGLTIKALFAPVAGRSGRLTEKATAPDDQIHRVDANEFLLSGKVVAATGVDITTYDTVQDGTIMWRILSIQEERPGPLSLLFHLNVTR